MPIEYRTGDLFAQPDLDALAHGCNCVGAMGAGIAVQFRKRWPEMYAQYVKLCAEGGFRLGDVFMWQPPDRSITVFNLATQSHWKLPADLMAVQDSLREAVSCMKPGERLGIPWIGSGLGGLAQADVRRVFEDIARTTPVIMVVVELPVG